MAHEPALELDAALVHVDHCDERGNGQILGPDPYFDDLFCGAAKRRYVSCESILSTEKMVGQSCVHTMVLNRTLTDGVIEAPFGAHPTACVPKYGIDVPHLEEYSKSAKDADAWARYRERYVDVDEASYLETIGGAERVLAIPPPVF